MKNPLIHAITIILLVFVTTAQAQDFNPKKNNYLILSKNIKQLKPVLVTADELVKSDGEKYGEFYMIICGKTVKNIPNNKDFDKLLKKAKKHKIKVLACGISLKQFNIKASELPDSISVVGNGILHGLQLTKQGFITLSI